MLTLFPSLLMYSFFVPMILRIAVAAVFLYQALSHFKSKRAFADELNWKSHEMAVWAVGLLILAEFAFAILLFVGAWTQLVAILAALGFTKMILFKHKFPSYAPLAKSSYVLLVVISLTLVITGAGAFAFDLPL